MTLLFLVYTYFDLNGVSSIEKLGFKFICSQSDIDSNTSSSGTVGDIINFLQMNS